jgi:hypothetical protein
MKVIVLDSGEWKPSAWNDGQNRRVTFKDIDNPKDYYYLNITEAHPNSFKWIPLIEEGNILEVQIMSGTRNVNKFGDCQLVHLAEDGNKSSKIIESKVL